MCFSNLPIEFDDEGNPYLADEADEVERPEDVPEDEAPLDADPETAYADIVECVPEGVREELAGESAEGHTTTESGRDDQHESARSD